MSVEQMRDHFNRVAEQRLRQGLWTEAGKAECNGRIKEAIASGDAEEIKRWADWLAGIVADERLPAFRVVNSACVSCRRIGKPGALVKGESEVSYCSGRDDLPPAYGAGHPMRKLPADGGATCSSWRAR
jgi:hypothetical protein